MVQKPRFVILELPFRGRDEFLPLQGKPEYRTVWMRPQAYRGGAQVLILPGSGRTIDDLLYLQAHGGTEIIRHHLAMGGVVVGVCGGYQILGKTLIDPQQKQGPVPLAAGLGWLPLTTLFGPAMLNSYSSGRLLVGCGKGQMVGGIEYRSGCSVVEPSTASSLIKVVKRKLQSRRPRRKQMQGQSWSPGHERFDGLVSSDRRLWGTYFHLIFHNPAFLQSFFASLPA